MAKLLGGIGKIPWHLRVRHGSSVAKSSRWEKRTISWAVGAPTGRIIRRHVLLNRLSLVVTAMSIGVNIIVVAGLSFLGFGVRPPMPSWGAMLQQAQEFMHIAWWMAVYPDLCTITTVFGFNILGDSLRDVLDLRLK